MAKTIYRFGKKTDGDGSMKNLLGGKGAGLAQMSRIGIPVPPGFTITTEQCVAYQKDGELTAQLKHDIITAYVELRTAAGGHALVSVRSGARVSMPGMMDTILNVGITSESIGHWEKTLGDRAAWDCYRRLVQMYGSVAMGVPEHLFSDLMEAVKSRAGVDEDKNLKVEDLKTLVYEYMKIIQASTGQAFPATVEEQLYGATEAVFKSWNNARAITYRKMYKIPETWGTAVTVQTMVFGNLNDDSGSGVLFTRSPSSGEKFIFGEFLPNAQGEDVVAGIRTPIPLGQMSKDWPEVLKQLHETVLNLEKYYKDMQDVEFTVQDRKLYLLQTRTGKRSALAAFRIAVDMLQEGLIDTKTAVSRITPEQFKAVKRPRISPSFQTLPDAVGIPGCPGIVTGVAVMSSKKAEKSKVPCILVTRETNPDDIGGMCASVGILTATGGATSHAAVVARSMDKACVVGCTGMQAQGHSFIVSSCGTSKTIEEGTKITIDGATGYVWVDIDVPLVDGSNDEYVKLMLGHLNTVGSFLPIVKAGAPGALSYVADCSSKADVDNMLKNMDKTSVLDLSHVGEFMTKDAALWSAFGRREEILGSELREYAMRCLIDHKFKKVQGMSLRGVVSYDPLFKLLILAGYRLSSHAKTIADLMMEEIDPIITPDFVHGVLGGAHILEQLKEAFPNMKSGSTSLPGKHLETAAFEMFGR